MTFSVQTNRVSAVGSGSIGQVVPFTFPIAASTDLVCYKRVTLTGVQTTLVLTTNYTVTITGDTGGTVTTVTAIETTEEIHVVRSTPATQTLDLEHGGTFSAENIEDALDKNTKLSIERKDKDDRSIKFPETDPASSIGDIPNSIDRASKTLTFDSAGKPTATAAATTTVSFSAYGETLVDDVDAEAARDTLELNGGSAELDIGAWKMQGPILNVKHSDYGATGDGVTDDSTAIQTAITAAGQAGTGGVVFLPVGTYSIASTVLTMRPSVMLVGASRSNSIIKYDGADVAIRFSGDTAAGLENLKIQCTHDSADGVEITEASSYTTFRRLLINNDGAAGGPTGAAFNFPAAATLPSLFITMDTIRALSFKYGLKWGATASVNAVSGTNVDLSGNSNTQVGSRGVYMGDNADGVGTYFIGGSIEGFEQSIEVTLSTGSAQKFSWNGDIEGNGTANAGNFPSLSTTWEGIIRSSNGGWALTNSTNGPANIWHRTHHFSSDDAITETWNNQICVVRNGNYQGISGNGALALHMSGSAFNADGTLNKSGNSTTLTAYPQGGFVGSGGHAIGPSPESYRMFVRDRWIAFSTAVPTGGAWSEGSIIYDTTLDAGGPLGWVCLTSGTFGAATNDGAATTTSGSAIITGMNTTAAFNIGDWIDIDADFSNPRKILSKTLTSIRVDANASGSTAGTVTVDTTAPTFSVFGMLQNADSWAALTNVSTSRSFDADTVNVAALADVVGTLILDLRTGGILKGS